MKISRTLLALCIGCIICTTAWADLVTLGDPEPADSWLQAFGDSGIGRFYCIIVQMTSPSDYFEHPSLSAFSQNGWNMDAEAYLGPGIVVARASGPRTTVLNWTIRFDGNLTNALSFTYWAYDYGALRNWATVSWSGKDWTIVNNYGQSGPVPLLAPSPVTVIPAPAALLLGAMGLGLVGVVRARRARR